MHPGRRAVACRPEVATHGRRTIGSLALKRDSRYEMKNESDLILGVATLPG